MATLPVLAEGLRKRYGRANALDGFDLAVSEGTVCGLLGPNGAGKTTAVRILTTLLWPDGGSARVAGFDVVGQAAQVRYRIGLLGQQPAVDEVLSGRLADDVVAGHPGPAPVGPEQGGQDAHGGGLAGPVGAEQAAHRAFGHGQVEAVEGAGLAVAFAQPFGQDG